MISTLGAVLVLVWARGSGIPWRELGFARPKSWLGTATAGLVLGFALKLLMKAVVMPVLGADPINPTYHFITGNPAALPGMLSLVIVGAGFGEETVFRGFFFERLGKLFGEGAGAKTATVLLTSFAFGLAHAFDQGVSGVEQGTITGLVFGSIFALTGRIWLSMFAHVAFDLTAVFMIYWNLESFVAHLVFK